MRELVGSFIQLAVGDFLVFKYYGNRIGSSLCLLFK
jgi:hypothetical protein